MMSCQTAVHARAVRKLIRGLAFATPICLAVSGATAHADALSVEGVHVVPHVQSSEMRYRQKPDFSLGARVEVFLRNSAPEPLVIPSTADIRLRGRTPAQLLQADEWAWHDLPSAWGGDPLRLPPGAITVWSWNGKRALWGSNTQAELAVTLPGSGEADRLLVPIENPSAWLSAVTFLGAGTNVQPDALLFHVANRTPGPLRLEACRLWLPENNATWRALIAQPWISNRLERFPADGVIPSNDRGGAWAAIGPLPLTYAALEVKLADPAGKPLTLWAHQRIKHEVFDISGGWVLSAVGGSNTLQSEAFLKALRRLQVNTAHIADVAGYTDQTGPDGLYTLYPLKYFNKLEPFDHYDTEAMLPRIHAVEFLGEPQYGGGRPVPPQEVWQALAPYAPTRLPTSVTHSEERVWRFYAGLSDYPHYDAYRVTAPSADAWNQYDRWEGQRIRWGSPLETIGEMSRSLRELNRPRPTAYWSQGPHHDWKGYGGRKRGSPTPDELRLQAYHALASRITSLYWFNLSLRSLVTFPDLIEPMTRVGREIRMLEEFYLEGDATSHERLLRDGKPDWDLDVVAGPRGALLFALDLAYTADRQERVFKFGPARDATFRFRVPSYVAPIAEVFRVDADGTVSVEHTAGDGRITIRDRVSRVAVYVAATVPGERDRIEARRQALIAAENALGFEPGRNPGDLAILRGLLGE
ncbi:MAG: hypothetical protein KJ072_24420 [Verrucomicrobia bacterium]|nr:hypothetical protein [Verrucomicrobiota bacterium]